MLKQRMMTAFFYVLVVFAVIFVLPPVAAAVAFFLLAAGCFVEWMRLADLKSLSHQAICLALFSVISALIYVYPAVREVSLMIGCVVWVGITAWLMFCHRRQQIEPLSTRAVTGLGFVTLLPLFSGLLTIAGMYQGSWYMLMLFLTVWCSDTFAYFAGRALGGRHKLAPLFSPGKSYEGLLGAIPLTILALLAYEYVVLHEPCTWFKAFIFANAVLLSLVGDLFESALKRLRGVKDSGTLLPGHGGLLDRFDSLIALAPWMAFVLFTGAR